jgi:hypothetical protein
MTLRRRASVKLSSLEQQGADAVVMDGLQAAKLVRVEHGAEVDRHRIRVP